jgi:hypothetical protein
LSLTCSVFALVAIHQAPETRSCEDAWSHSSRLITEVSRCSFFRKSRTLSVSWFEHDAFDHAHDAQRAAQTVATPAFRSPVIV